MRARRVVATSVLGLALGGCQGWFSPPVQIDEPVRPLSKLYVHNATDTGYHVRMNWPDGFVQVSWIEPGVTQGLEGAIGTSAFPATIDVLTEDCEPLASLRGLAPGSAGIVVIGAGDISLYGLDFADAAWTTIGSIQACRATRVD